MTYLHTVTLKHIYIVLTEAHRDFQNLPNFQPE